jgi:hypothetical protein
LVSRSWIPLVNNNIRKSPPPLFAKEGEIFFLKGEIIIPLCKRGIEGDFYGL